MHKNPIINFTIAAYFFAFCTHASAQEITTTTNATRDANPLTTVTPVEAIQQIIVDYTNIWQHKTKWFFEHPVTALAFLPNSKLLVTGTENGTLSLWDENQNLIHALPNQSTSKITAIIALTDKKFISTTETGLISEWQLNQQDQIIGMRNTNTKCQINAFSYDPINHQCAIADTQEGAIRFYNLKTERVQKIKTLKQALVTTLAYSPDGKYIAAGARVHGGKIWDLTDNEPYELTQHEDSAILGISWLAHNKLIATHDELGSIRHIDTTNTRLLKQRIISDPTDIANTAQVYVPQTHQLITANTENKLQLWDVAKNTCTELAPHSDSISSLAVSPDGQYLACGSESEQTITFYQPDQLALILNSKKNKLA
jgi:WD40 repeat protein